MSLPLLYANKTRTWVPSRPRNKHAITRFPPFPRLPAEIKLMIWEHSLKPRSIELEWTQLRGFYSRISTPPALAVNRESRNSVRHLYTLCFGNLMYPPKTLFNFKLDTLFLSDTLQNQTLQLFAGLRPDELANLQYIAVAACINDDFEYPRSAADDSIIALNLIIPKFSVLKEVDVAWELAYNYDGNDEGGVGPLRIFGPELPPDFSHHCGPYQSWLNDITRSDHDDRDHVNGEMGADGTGDGDKEHGEDEGSYEDEDEYQMNQDGTSFPLDLCDCNELPEIPLEFKIIKGPKMKSVWSWRSRSRE